MDKKLSRDNIKPKALYDSNYYVNNSLGFCHKKPTILTVYKYPDKGN